jgi:tetratricopeptide (TPR) repeat protein
VPRQRLEEWEHRLKKKLAALVQSRVVGFVLIAVMSFAVVRLAVSLWPAVRIWPVRLVKVPDPKMDKLEPLPRSHIESMRRKLEAVLKDGSLSARQRAAAYGEMGKVYLAYEFLDAAAACLRNAGTLDPEDFRWPYLLARALDRNGQTAAGAAAMATALERMRKDVTAKPENELSALCFLGQAAYRLNKPADARRMFEAAIGVNARAPFPLVRLGQLASREADGARAVEYYERALQLLPGTPEIRNLMAAEYRRQGNTAKTAEYAVPADSMRKDRPLGYSDTLMAEVEELNRSGARMNRLGNQAAVLGHWREALQEFQQATAANPESAGAHGNYALALMAMGRIEAAQQQFEEALRLAPGSVQARAGLATAYVGMTGTRQKGIEMARALCADHPPKPEGLQAAASAFMAAGRYDEALGAYRDGAKLVPGEPWPLLGQSNALAALGRYAAARAALEQALRAFPSDAGVRSMLARFLVTSPDGASRDGRRGLEMSQALLAASDTVERRETVAAALAENGRFDDAVRMQQSAIRRCGEEGKPAFRERLQQVLHALEAHKPWREAWPYRTREGPATE